MERWHYIGCVAFEAMGLRVGSQDWRRGDQNLQLPEELTSLLEMVNYLNDSRNKQGMNF